MFACEYEDDDDVYDYFYPMPMPRRRERRSIAYPGRRTSNFVDSNEAFLVSTIAYGHTGHFPDVL